MNSIATKEPIWLRLTLTSIALLFLLSFLLVPLVAVFWEAFRQGWHTYINTLLDAETRSAILLTLLVATLSVPPGVFFGIAAAWLISKFDFKGKNILITLIDLPFAISPVVVGMLFILLFGANHGVLGPWLVAHNMKIIFALPGIVLVTLFVTFPFVARELIPLMQAQGKEEEEAATSLGASGWQMFWRVTLPNIKWGLLYGVILANARAMGEFGAVSVVSGHIRGETNTLPLHTEILYNEYNQAGAFTSASVLAMLALITVIAKAIVAWYMRQETKMLASQLCPERIDPPTGPTEAKLRTTDSKMTSP